MGAYMQNLTGLFFILPCMDKVNVVDLRTVTFDVPPQEVTVKQPTENLTITSFLTQHFLDSDKGQCYSTR